MLIEVQKSLDHLLHASELPGPACYCPPASSSLSHPVCSPCPFLLQYSSLTVQFLLLELVLHSDRPTRPLYCSPIPWHRPVRLVTLSIPCHPGTSVSQTSSRLVWRTWLQCWCCPLTGHRPPLHLTPNWNLIYIYGQARWRTEHSSHHRTDSICLSLHFFGRTLKNLLWIIPGGRACSSQPFG